MQHEELRVLLRYFARNQTEAAVYISRLSFTTGLKCCLFRRNLFRRKSSTFAMPLLLFI